MSHINMKREKSLEMIESGSKTDWDLIVIGGGATGLGVALDGVSRGFKVLVLEQADFAKGTPNWFMEECDIWRRVT